MLRKPGKHQNYKLCDTKTEGPNPKKMPGWGEEAPNEPSRSGLLRMRKRGIIPHWNGKKRVKRQ